jgi:hypothetical protein
MKATINGKRYNSDKCETLASVNHHCNGNYAGASSLLLASDGTYLILQESNGQDFYFRNGLFAANCENRTPQDFLEDCDLDEDQEKRLVALGLITMVE